MSINGFNPGRCLEFAPWRDKTKTNVSNDRPFLELKFGYTLKEVEMVKWRLGGDGDEVTDMLRQELEEALIGWSTARDSVEYEERLVEFVSLCL